VLAEKQVLLKERRQAAVESERDRGTEQRFTPPNRWAEAGGRRNYLIHHEAPLYRRVCR
jgi:hypothetical protein